MNGSIVTSILKLSLGASRPLLKSERWLLLVMNEICSFLIGAFYYLDCFNVTKFTIKSLILLMMEPFHIAKLCNKHQKRRLC